MQTSCGIIFILLLASLQGSRSNGNSTTSNISSTTKVPPTTQGTLNKTRPPGTTDNTLPVVHHTTSPTTNENAVMRNTIAENNTQSNSRAQNMTTGIRLFSTLHVMETTRNSTSISVTNSNRILSSSATSRTLNNTMTASTIHITGNESPKTTNHFITVTYNLSSTTVLSNKHPLVNPTEPIPTNGSPTTLSTSKSDHPTIDFKTISHATSVHQNLTNSSTVSSYPKETSKEKHYNGEIVFGATVGTFLGFALIGLIGYVMCRKRKSEPFCHQRLYDDTRSDPVLRLDNSPGSYDLNFGDLSYYNPSTTMSEGQDSRGRLDDSIPMNDMASSQPSM
ncbi:PREDICTED: mucin-15 [Crocodylus porosus]|uniref:mucin-15 n=1 Tax=Crocodylus porosus TaxID=8502 RepID=UPI00093D1BC4|nr:PREDICTED: mucin-15 [Crocodylus porosus]